MDQHDFLLKRMTMVGGNETKYSGQEADVDYDNDAIGDKSTYPNFWEWNGAAHLTFPVMDFDKEHVPMGDSVSFCLGLQWTTIKKRA
jgi:hypothetical protein